MEERARAVGLFRYSLIAAAAQPALSGAERGALVRQIAARTHAGPTGEAVVVSRNTLDRWIRAYRAGGFDALVPAPRNTDARTPATYLELAEALRVEEPARTAAHIARLIAEAKGWSPSARTVQRHLAKVGLAWKGSQAKPSFGRFEAGAANELWVGDALHGPRIGARRTYLFAFLDDFSRALVGYRWCHAEDTLRLEAALRSGIAARGVPSRLYLDNGSAMVSTQLLRACAVLGIVLVHSRPGRPQGRGKIERVFRTVNESFVVELSHTQVTDLDRLNGLFAAWVESVYHRQVHSETGAAPIERFLSAGPPAPVDTELLDDAFRWSERRRVTKTASVSLFSNQYEVDTALVGEMVELVFNPFDLAEIEVRFAGRPMGKAIPRHIGRHVHPAAKPEPGPAPAPKEVGIDYLGLIEARRRAELTKRIDYRDLPESDEEAAE